jgi:outer membrane protein assembly factor BamC
MRTVNRPSSVTAVQAATLALVAMLSGCSMLSSITGSDDKIDYRSQAQKTAPLEVPPDLTQLQREGRYQPQSGVVNASNYSPSTVAPAGAASTQAVAPQQVGDVRLERNGNARWLVTSQTPEQVWPQLRTFWTQLGFNIATDSAETGVMETDWAENRAKLPNDFIRNTLGKLIDSLYSTGERDKFRTRVERTANGTEITISHRGMEEVVNDKMSGTTTWTARPSDPNLEAEMLARLMVKLGAKEQEARAAVAQAAAASAAPGAARGASAPAAATGPARARAVAGQPATLQVDEPFDRAWRRVGLALDRSGFTVEDRDRANGIYYVRYADPKLAGQDEPNWFSKLFSRGNDKAAPARYRIEVARSQEPQTLVSVKNSAGQPETGDIGQRISALLLEDLK